VVDWALGKELPFKYNRDALKYLIRKSIDLKVNKRGIYSI
jgi:hypothetical protein